VNPSEIAAWRWVPSVEVDRLIENRPEEVTPWFIMEWQRLRTEYRELLAALEPRRMISAA
jgi:isopentenyl-diphosphate delta-isomerase